MRKLLTVMIITVGLGIFAETYAQASQTLMVRIGQERAARGNIRVRFLTLVEDSRCPTGTQCVWAGTAKIKIQVRFGSRTAQTFEIETNGDAVMFRGYRIKLTNLIPHPANNIRINRNGYVAMFRITNVSR